MPQDHIAPEYRELHQVYVRAAASRPARRAAQRAAKLAEEGKR